MSLSSFLINRLTPIQYKSAVLGKVINRDQIDMVKFVFWSMEIIRGYVLCS